jgi:adenosyl cobinamide kinase/adenosyl cobinamide phosphate guanylyltransferase
MKIGIVGHARVGKDTFAEYLIECLKKRHQRDFKHVAFAAQLKEMCQEHFELTNEQLWGDKKEEWTKFVRKPKINLDGYKGSVLEPLEDYWTAREIMQELGSFYRRIDHDFWVKALNMYLISNDIKDAIITDVRHINECEYVKINKGILIRIIRTGADEIHGMDHESETALDDVPDGYFDLTIVNNWSLEELEVVAEESSDIIINLENMINKGRIVKNGKE